MTNNQLMDRLDGIEAMLKQLLATQPHPMLDATEDEIFDKGIAQGKSIDEITREINDWKEMNEK